MMSAPKIPHQEFQQRINSLTEQMDSQGMDALLVYGDEYRKENLRYVSNYWPIFERGALVLGKGQKPMVLCAPEGEQVAKEMSIWPDVRLIPDFVCVTVPDKIDYPHANYSSFSEIASELRSKVSLKTLGVAGLGDMSEAMLENVRNSFSCHIADANPILFKLRKEKSENEIACLREAARLAEAGFRAMMESELIGKTERYAAAIAEGVARKEGAECITFTVFGSGERSARIIGRAENKIIEDGDMIMCALAIQYEGYVSTYEIPFAVGNYSAKTKRVIDVLINASEAGLPHLKPGEPMKHFVRAVRDHFRKEGLAEYDVYPPLHGIGCAEAESPYTDENTDAVFESGMTVNTDISLFGLEGGSNRVEEGFVIRGNGAETLCPFMRNYFENWK